MKSFFMLLLVLCYICVNTIRVRAEVGDEQITAPSFVLIEESTGRVLSEKDPHEKRACASITNVMTLLLAMEAIESEDMSIQEEISISEQAASMAGSNVFLKAGESMSVEDLLKSIAIVSANDASIAVAERMAGSEKEFVVKMNKKAVELGMTDTIFKNCTGYDEEGHVTSAYDVALMSRELMKHPRVFDYTSVWIDYLRAGKTQLVNTNKLLKTYKGITGLKTGTTDKAKCCMVASAKKEGLSLISVVLGCKNSKDRFNDSEKLLNYGFVNYTMYSPEVNESDLIQVKVRNGLCSYVNTRLQEQREFCIKKGTEKKMRSKVDIPDQVDAPIDRNCVLGSVTFYDEEEVVAKYDVIADRVVDEVSFIAIIRMFFLEAMRG